MQARHGESRFFFEGGIEFLLALQHGVEALNGGDADSADVVELVRLHVLDVVQLGERTVLLGRDERLELLERLPAEIAAIHQEQHPLGAGVLDEPVDEIAGGVGLAAAAGHLDERPRALLGERYFQVARWP